ncbi:OstA-like protein [Robiginitalea biformata]|uniref:OstA-like protein n=1 Tax=Robiginitalea biformata TaxID=252307 RepID=UPI000320FC04|nr:OstA-like protein [Robiginitalea biformata]
MRILVLILACLLSIPIARAQADSTQNRKINIVYGGNFTKDESLRPGASIFSRDTRQVQFEHQGADLWCDYAFLYQKDNRLEAIGNVRLEQGDSVLMTSGRVEYNGNLRLAKAYESVRLENQSMTLTTDTLYFDRERQEAYYRDFGRIVDSVNTLTSEVGRYFMVPKKYQFQDSVLIKNPDYTLESTRLDYYTNSKNAYMYGPSTITGEDYTLYCERGFYDTRVEQGYGIRNTEIHYNDRIIEGDSVYFDKASEFASATNNIVITDTINKGVIRAHYAEVHRARDSVFATRRAVSISLVEQDSLYMHGDTLMVTGAPDARILRAYRNAKFFKTDLSGKCDSIHFEERTGITQLIREPVIWNLENQMTGDSIYLLSDLETQKPDSLKVLGNAFLISEDTIGHRGYNQAKGKDLFGKFIEDQLKIVDLVGNTEVVYFMYDDDNELIGIDKTVCSRIRLLMEASEIQDITFFIDPDGVIYPEADLPEESRILEGFIWRGDERMYRWQDVFDEDDNNLELPVIRGLSEPIDLESKPVPPDPDGPRFPKDDKGRPALRRSGTKTDSQKS